MKKEFLLLSALISSAIFVYLIYPISNLKQLDKPNVSQENLTESQSNQFSINNDTIDLTFDIFCFCGLKSLFGNLSLLKTKVCQSFLSLSEILSFN